MLKAILFDLDHTLIDWDHASSWEDFQRERMSAILQFIGAQGHTLNGATVDALFEAFITGISAAWIDSRATLIAPQHYRVITEALISVGIAENTLDADTLMRVYDWQPRPGECVFPDAVEVLPQLFDAGMTLGIVTNASQPMVDRDRELHAFGLIDWFPNCRISAADIGYIKPHRSIFDRALALAGVEPHEAVFVGDNLEADIYGAQGAGMRAVWRENDHDQRGAAERVIPDGTITTLHDLPPLLDRWYPGWNNGHAR